MKLITIAVQERTKQLTRKMNSEPNELIKEIIRKEIENLAIEMADLHKLTKK